MKKRRFHIDGNYYDIPETEVYSFLSDNPKATEVVNYKIKGSEYNIPLHETEAFENDMGFKKKEPSVSLNGISQSPLYAEAKDVFSFEKFADKEHPYVNPDYPIRRKYNGKEVGFKSEQDADFYESNNGIVHDNGKPKNLEQAVNKDKQEHGNRFGYILNNLVEGIGSEISGANDAIMQGVISILPQSVVGSDKNTAIKQWREKVTPQVKGTIEKVLADPISESRKEKYDKEFLTSMAGGLAHFAPAILSPKGTKFAALVSQGYDAGLQHINSTENGKNLPENYKTIFGAGVGVAQAVLFSLGIDKILGKGLDKIAVGLASRTFNKLLQSSSKAITAEIFETALQAEAKTFKSQLINAGSKIAESALVTGMTGVALEGTNILAEEITNKATGKEIFEPNTWGNAVGRIAHNAANFTAMGAIMGAATLPFSKTRNYISEKVSEAKSSEDIVNLKQELNNDKLSEEESQHLNDLVDNYVRVNSKVPDDVPNRKEAVEKIIEREDIENEIAKKQDEIQNVDVAFQPERQKEIEVLSNRTEEINQEILNPKIETEETAKVPDTKEEAGITNESIDKNIQPTEEKQKPSVSIENKNEENELKPLEQREMKNLIKRLPDNYTIEKEYNPFNKRDEYMLSYKGKPVLNAENAKAIEDKINRMEYDIEDFGGITLKKSIVDIGGEEIGGNYYSLAQQANLLRLFGNEEGLEGQPSQLEKMFGKQTKQKKVPQTIVTESGIKERKDVPNINVEDVKIIKKPFKEGVANWYEIKGIDAGNTIAKEGESEVEFIEKITKSANANKDNRNSQWSKVFDKIFEAQLSPKSENKEAVSIGNEQNKTSERTPEEIKNMMRPLAKEFRDETVKIKVIDSKTNEVTLKEMNAKEAHLKTVKQIKTLDLIINCLT